MSESQLMAFSKRRLVLALGAVLVFFAPFTRAALEHSTGGGFNLDEIRNAYYEVVVKDNRQTVNIDDLASDPYVNLDDEKLWQKIVPEDDEVDEGDKNVLLMQSTDNVRYICRLPSDKATAEETKQAKSYSPEFVSEIVEASFHINKCIEMITNGWWSYKFCYHKDIVQMHRDPKGLDTVHSLGNYREWSKQWKFGTRPSLTGMGGIDRDVPYFEERYEDGSLCQLKQSEGGQQKKRKTVIRYECGAHLLPSQAVMVSVDEPRSCEYIVTIRVGSLCRLDQFALPDLSSVTQKIPCTRFLNREQRLKQIDELREAVIERRRILADQDDCTKKMWSAKRVAVFARRTALLSENNGQIADFRDRPALWNKDVLYQKLQIDSMVATRAYFYALFASTDVEAKVVDFIVEAADYADVDWSPSLYSTNSLDIKDIDRLSIWYYFKDRNWPKNFFPRSVNSVDLKNGLYRLNRASMQHNDLKYIDEDDILYFGIHFKRDSDRLRKAKFRGRLVMAERKRHHDIAADDRDVDGKTKLAVTETAEGLLLGAKIKNLKVLNLYDVIKELEEAESEEVDESQLEFLFNIVRGGGV